MAGKTDLSGNHICTTTDGFVFEINPDLGAFVAVDGIYGPATENAVQAFQRLFGLTADGIVGPRTWERLVGIRLLLR